MAEASARTEAPGKGVVLPWVVAVAAWVVPGLGHVLLRRWGKALVIFLAVGALAVTGLALRGHIFSTRSGDPFEMLGYLADLGAGAFFYLARFVENGGPDVSRAAGDYGTRFFATAGVLNLLCAMDAFEIASGRRS